MRSRRLDRLARLTQGAALIGLGVSTLACTKDPPPTINAPPELPHVNATVSPTPSAPPTTSSAPASSSAPAAEAAAPSNHLAPSSTPPPPLPIHVNATATPPNAPPKKP